MSFGTSSGGMVPTVGFPFPAVASGSFTVVKTGVYEAHLVGGGSGGYGEIIPPYDHRAGSGAAVIFGRKLLTAGQVVNYIVGAGGIGILGGSLPQSALNGGTTVFDQFAANGGKGTEGGFASDVNRAGGLNPGYNGGSGASPSTGTKIPHLAGEVRNPSKTSLSPDGGASAYGAGGATVGSPGVGYGGGGAKGSDTIFGGNGSQGCIYLFGPL